LRANNGFVSEILTQPYLTRANYLFDKVGKMLRHFWSGHMLTGLPCVPRFTPAAQHQPASMLQPIDDASHFRQRSSFVNLHLSRKFTYPVLEQHGRS
jgi:hypothetical protein